jgi:hypothetical protein
MVIPYASHEFFKKPCSIQLFSITDFFPSKLIIFVLNDLGGWCQGTKISTIFHKFLAHKVEFGQHTKIIFNRFYV